MAGDAENNSDRGHVVIWRVVAWSGAALLLLAPLVAMQFTEEVRWTGSDFAVFGVMLAVPLGALELAVRARRSMAYRAAVAVAVGASFLMAWTNLAVGIIGSEDNSLNLVFFGVLAIGIVGALIAGFQPRGMTRAMAAMGVSHILVAVIALISGHVTVVLTGFFIGAWLLSAWLFRRAAKEQTAAEPTG
jgi:cbb3-type cytochrome oxidase subunit 3